MRNLIFLSLLACASAAKVYIPSKQETWDYIVHYFPSSATCSGNSQEFGPFKTSENGGNGFCLTKPPMIPANQAGSFGYVGFAVNFDVDTMQTSAASCTAQYAAEQCLESGCTWGAVQNTALEACVPVGAGGSLYYTKKVSSLVIGLSVGIPLSALFICLARAWCRKKKTCGFEDYETEEEIAARESAEEKRAREIEASASSATAKFGSTTNSRGVVASPFTSVSVNNPLSSSAPPAPQSFGRGKSPGASGPRF